MKKHFSARGIGESPKAAAQSHLPPHWQDRVVWGIDGKPTEQTLRFLTAQQRAEGGTAKWNPCNCTIWVQNFTDLPNYNDIPVRNYSYANVGVVAHVLTLTQRNPDGTLKFGKMYNELQSNWQNFHTAEQMVQNAWEDLKRWAGTSSDDYPNLIMEILKEI